MIFYFIFISCSRCQNVALSTFIETLNIKIKMNNNNNDNKELLDFDFDHWANVAKQDPEQFEQMRLELIDELMEQVPESYKPRIQGLQWQIDQIRNQADNPMAACLSISQKMWDKVYGEKGLLVALQEPEKILQSLNDNDADNIVPIKKYKSID